MGSCRVNEGLPRWERTIQSGKLSAKRDLCKDPRTARRGNFWVSSLFFFLLCVLPGVLSAVGEALDMAKHFHLSWFWTNLQAVCANAGVEDCDMQLTAPCWKLLTLGCICCFSRLELMQRDAEYFLLPEKFCCFSVFSLAIYSAFIPGASIEGYEVGCVYFWIVKLKGWSFLCLWCYKKVACSKSARAMNAVCDAKKECKPKKYCEGYMHFQFG